MNWVTLSLLSALGESVRDALGKRVVNEHNRIAVLWITLVATLPWFTSAVAVEGLPTVPSEYWPILIGGGVLGTYAQYLYVSALAFSDISLVLPLVAFSPALMLLTTPLLVGEYPSPAGLAGIVMIVSGSYLMNVGGGGRTLFAPFQALLSDRGARRMLGVAVIWSITSNFDKMGIRLSSPSYWLLTVVGVNVLLLTPLAVRSWRNVLVTLRSSGPLLLIAGSLFAIALLCQMTAVKLAPVAYVISLKRTSALFGVLLGYLFFHERDILKRMFGAAIMVLGVSVIALF